MTELISLDDYKTYKLINSNENDTRLSRIVSSVNSYVVNYCGRTFLDYYSTDKVEYFDATRSMAYLSEMPLISITSVKTSSDGGVTQVALTENEDYFVDIDNDRILAYNGSYFLATSITFKSLEITYKGGYAKIPEDLKIGILDLVEYYNKEEYIPNRNAGSSSITFITNRTDTKLLPAHIGRVLDIYRVL